MDMKLFKFAFIFMMSFSNAFGASVVASVNGSPITDADITARTKLMARQGDVSTDNRRKALQNIIDDSVKLNYASNFGVKPNEDDVTGELKRINMNDLTGLEREMALSAIRANIAWQIVVARQIIFHFGNIIFADINSW